MRVGKRDGFLKICFIKELIVVFNDVSWVLKVPLHLLIPHEIKKITNEVYRYYP